MHTQARTANNWSYCAAFTNLAKDAHPNSELFGDLAFSAWDWGVFGQGAHNVMKVWRNLGAHTVPGGSGLVILARRCSGPANHPIGLDRNEVGALLVAAGLGAPSEHALISLLALTGLRVFRSHRRQRRGARARTWPPDPASATKGRQDSDHPFGPSHGESGRPRHRRTPWRADHHWPRWSTLRPPHGRAHRAAGGPPCRVEKPIGPHTLRHAFITAALDAGVPLRDVQKAASHADPRTTMRYDRARVSLDRHITYIVATYVAGTSR